MYKFPNSGCNKGCKTFAERGKLPLKLTLVEKVDFAKPALPLALPLTLLNKGESGLCPKHYFPSRKS